MKIRYWGTAAAEGIPSLFCSCPRCVEAREKKGKFIRTRSQLLIDDTLLVDFNADTYMHSLKYDFDLGKLKDVLITHVHEDHFYPNDILYRKAGFAPEVEIPTLTFHGSGDLKDDYLYHTHGDYDTIDRGRIAFHELDRYKWYEIAGYRVASLPATHGTHDPRVYVIQKNGKTAFILNDSGMMRQENFEWLKNEKVKFDLVSYDCTGDVNDTLIAWGKNASHMGLKNIIATREILKNNGNYLPGTIDIVTHFTHNGVNSGYQTMKEIAGKEGFITSFDGMETEF